MASFLEDNLQILLWVFVLQIIFKKICSGNVLKVEFLQLIGSYILANYNPPIHPKFWIYEDTPSSRQSCSLCRQQ